MKMTSKIFPAALAVALGSVTLVAAGPVLANQSGHGGMQGAGGRMMGMMFDFAAMDTDGDGKVTQAEIQAHRQAEVAGMDADGDGLISQAELAGFMAERMQKVADQVAADRIKAQDSDGDGKLSAAEMQMPPMAGRMFERMDSDGDGALSQAEIEAMKAKMADRGEHGKRKHGWFGWGDDEN
ncbi:MAG: calcium-binding protein [Albidovulum sp.]